MVCSQVQVESTPYSSMAVAGELTVFASSPLKAFMASSIEWKSTVTSWPGTGVGRSKEEMGTVGTAGLGIVAAGLGVAMAAGWTG